MFKLKHKPTGLFYSPKSASGHLNQRGKIYHYAKVIISGVLPEKGRNFRICVTTNSYAHKKYGESLKELPMFLDRGYEYIVETAYEDWEIVDLLKKDPIDLEKMGAKIVDYCKQYEGSDKYNVAMLAIEFGYQLALKNK